MKTSNVGLSNLLNQLSEEKINLVVDDIAVKAGWESSSCSSSGSKSNNKYSKSNNKYSKSNNGNG